METLIIVSGTGSVLIMTRMWDVLLETPLFQSDFGEGIFISNLYITYMDYTIIVLFLFPAKFVTVGWGSKETQFHGSEGKDARGKKEVQATLASWDDKKARIVWRADGLYFAINAVDPSAGST